MGSCNLEMTLVPIYKTDFSFFTFFYIQHLFKLKHTSLINPKCLFRVCDFFSAWHPSNHLKIFETNRKVCNVFAKLISERTKPKNPKTIKLLCWSIFSLNPNEAEYLFCRNEALELSKQQWTSINKNLLEVKLLSWLDLRLFRFIFTQDEPAIIKRKIDLQYKVFGKKRSEDSTMKAGALTVSAVFQPIESVAKSGENGWICENLPH